MLAILAGLRTAQGWLAALPQIVIALLVTLPLTFLLGQCSGERHANAKNQAARAVANVETIKTDGAAKEIAANERLTDTVLIDEKHKELLDAVQSAPDSAPDAARVQLGCARLRQAGRDTATIAACR